MSWHERENLDISKCYQETQQNPIKVNIVVEYVDGDNNEEERMEIEENVFVPNATDDLVNAVMKTAYLRKKEFFKLLEEYSELVKKIQNAERKLTNEKYCI